MDQLIFLGTGGARMVMSSQVLSTGGFILEMDDTLLSIDPGPGAIVHATREKLKLQELKGILLSHRHLDHCGDVNVMIEAMTRGGYDRSGVVFAPGQALYEDPVVLKYLWKYVGAVKQLEERKSYSCGRLEFKTSLAHRHGDAETYGFLFHGSKGVLGYLPDTRYFPELASFYKCDILIVSNLLLHKGKVDHLCASEVAQLLKEISPAAAILTHFGMSMWKAGVDTIADKIAQKAGVRVIAAKDGMRLELSELMKQRINGGEIDA